ncbi:TIGR04282 family arsenosugar biosynthesis glycosyltransferase [Actinoplanes sp. N902-109]|uniref:TIGR04282 family arsenosugar biosynthesis glycosyltransferase n=1 Tax=Actinoplanes sp. (strain N902-109) TaxID=649831 RepID=UPI0003294470|nr:TIGR04282 family arsenosugar biosynthesis glycosyltransferase [Actinoplanes sp. N902-109]AGL16905.1 hypothetical protein L083_3395 [Actinoplanes sp. N902-109]
MTVRLIVLAKTPVPGRVKTRLCPPYTPQQAARLAAAALTDTLDTVAATLDVAPALVVEGAHPAPPGWTRTAQRGTSLGERIAHAFAATALPGRPSLLIGMDTPQLTTAVLAGAVRSLAAGAPAVFGPAADGGWWALGLADPLIATVLRDVPMSTADTGARTLTALRRAGVEPAGLPTLRDVDTAADAAEVAAMCPPGSRFAAACHALRPRVVA